MTVTSLGEAILEPDLPIVDPHHHLWDRGPWFKDLPPPVHGFDKVIRRSPRYLLDELVADTSSGHNIRATVFVECRSMYRMGAEPGYDSLGETEFVNGQAAM